jgi:hypothetical protein
MWETKQYTQIKNKRQIIVLYILIFMFLVSKEEKILHQLGRGIPYI